MDDLLDLAKLARMEDRCELRQILSLGHLQNYLAFVRDVDFKDNIKDTNGKHFRIRLPHEFPVSTITLWQFDSLKTGCRYDWECTIRVNGHIKNNDGYFSSIDSCIDDMIETIDIVLFP